MKSRPRASTIRASEIGSHQFCERAWGYHRKGVESLHQEEMQIGTRLHEAHGRAVFSAALFRLGGGLALLAALVLSILVLLDRFL